MAALTAALLTVGMLVPTAASAAEDSAVVQLTKNVNGVQTDFQPGDTFSYEIQVGCSSTIDSICVDLAIEDALPAPLVFNPGVPNPVVVSMSPSGSSDVQVDQDGSSFTVRPQHSGVYEGAPVTGLSVGGTMLLTVSVMVPTTTGGDFDNQTITNTATADAANSLPVSSPADITLDVETTLAPTITKSVSTGTVPAVSGRAVDWTITPGNGSNQTVDQLVMQDPAVIPGGFDPYLDITGVDITAPDTTDAQAVEYYVAGAWTTTAPDPLSGADGIRVTFDGEYAPGASGTVVVHTITTAAVEEIPSGDTRTVDNVAQATVSNDGETSDPVTADASVQITANDPDVTITKSFEDATLVSGQSTIATVTATNGVQNVQSLTITEPSAGQPGFTDQGLVFNGFGDGLAWPIAATEATITYAGAGCVAGAQSTETSDTLPAAPAGCVADGFVVTFAADGDDILASAYATLPIEVTAIARDEATTLSSTNHVDTEVENTSGQTGTDEADAAFTIAPLIVGTEVSKDITPPEVWGVPGADANISLSGKVSDDATVGSDYLLISDPADPTDPASAAFWDAFTPVDIDNTDIPECTQLTLNYWSEDADAWMPLPGAVDVQGTIQGYSYEIPEDITDIGGIQYVFEPTCQATLPPGFTVLTNLGVEVSTAHDAETIYTNDVQSQVDNEDSVVREPTDEDDDQIQVNPLTGDGPDFVDKAWLEDDVLALSDEVRTARLSWSTQGLNITEMTITDPATQGQLDDVATSVYDAFDLAEIPAITPAIDPLIVDDVVTEVWLYLDGSGWTNVTVDACALGCTGVFGGFDLVAAGYADDALGVRMVFHEREAGEGVGSSYDRRPLDLDFRIRDTLRSDPAQYVLGTFHPYTYNTTDAGVVNNTVAANGVGPGIDSTSTAADTITIIDSPINVDLTKTFDQDQLGLPAEGTAADDYPLITSEIVATNRSAVKVSSIRIDDASPDQTAPTAYDVLDLHEIRLGSAPAGLTLGDATVTLVHAGVDVEYSAAEAAALTPAQLEDVTALSVVFATDGGEPLIQSGATATVGLVWQLRAEKRSGGPVEITEPGGEPILNEARTLIDSPGRIDCPATGCSTGTADAADEFDLVAANYAIRTAKSITPASIAENGSTAYSTTLTGQPLGTARTTVFTLTDDTPTFWNTMDFVGLQIDVPQPVNQLKVDALVGADLVLDGTDLVAMCDGAPVDASSTCWVEGAWTAVSGTAMLTLPATVDPTDVVGIRMHARQMTDGAIVQWERPYNPTLNYLLTTERRDTVRSDPGLAVSTTRPGLAPNPGETLPGVISNDLEADSTGQFGIDQVFTAHEEADDTTLVTHLTNAIRVTKTRGSTPLVNPAGNINYLMTVTNTGQWDMTGFNVMDQITAVNGQSPVVEPDSASYTFSITGPGAPTGATGFQASLDDNTGILTIVNPDPAFVFRAGWTLTISAPLRFRDGLSPDVTVANTATATADRDFERCESTTTDLTPKPVETNVSACSADTTVAPRASAPVAMKKWVKGDQAGDPATTDDDLGVYNVTGAGDACDPATPGVTDDGFYSYPCMPITRPGGEATWRLDFTNTGNTNAKVVAAVDTLPRVGDQGVIVPSGRGSQFPVALTGLGSVNWAEITDAQYAAASVFFSNSVQSQACNQNAIQVYTANATPDASCTFDWQVFSASTSEADLVDAQSVLVAIEFDNPDSTVPAPGLRPGETLTLTVNSRTPWSLPAESAVASGIPVAYNSFAGASRTVATATQPERAELVLEPQRVGIATATGQLQLVKTVDAPDFSGDIQLPDTYPMLVTCLSGGAEVDLQFADGSDASRPDVPGDGSIYVYDNHTGPVNLPLFAECSLIEDPVPPGAAVEVTPASVIADRDIAVEGSVFHPYSGDLEATQIDIVNTFAAGGFTVSKTVDAGGAVDQDGTPIMYDQVFPFEATCTYLGQEALATADRAFDLAAGETKEVAGIPVGADCTVTETGAGVAVETTTVLTVGSDDPEAGDTNDVDFTIVEGSASITTAAFTNVFGVGSLALEKTLTGEAADDFGAGPFTLHVTCTLPAADPNTVYDGEVVLGGDSPLSAQIDDIPTAAVCAVAETDTAGATSTTVTGSPAAVGDDTVVSVTVTNEFTSAPLTVVKEIDGDGADLYGAGPFEVALSCVDVSGTEVAIPGGATRELSDQNGYRATYDPLLVGLQCALVETDAGGATSATTVDGSGDPIDGPFEVPADAFEITLTNTFDLGSLVVTKSVSGGKGESHRGDEFEVMATCTLNGQLIVMPDGAVRTISVATPAVFEDLPIGAECAVVETDDGGADSVTMTPADPTDTTKAVVVIGADAAASVTVDNHFGAALAVTGTTVAWVSLGTLATLLLIVGAVVLLVSRRRRMA